MHKNDQSCDGHMTLYGFLCYIQGCKGCLIVHKGNEATPYLKVGKHLFYLIGCSMFK